MARRWNLGLWVTSHSMSLEMAPFDRSHTSSYWRPIVTMALSCIISEIKRDIGKMAIFYTPAIDAPWLGFRWNIFIRLDTEKLEWCGSLTVKKFEDVVTRFDRIHESEGRTDAQTNTAWWHRSRLCIASHGKTDVGFINTSSLKIPVFVPVSLI